MIASTNRNEQYLIVALIIAISIFNPFIGICLFCTLKKSPGALLVALLLLIVTSKTRIGYFGDDIQYYLKAFNQLGTNNNIFQVGRVYLNSIDSTFLGLSWLLKHIVISNRLVYIFIVLISLLLIIWVYKKIDSQNYGIMLLVLITANSFMYSFGNTIRQGLASAFLLVSIYYFYKEEKAKGWFFITLMLTSHFTSVLFLPFVFLRKRKLNVFYFFILAFMLLGLTKIPLKFISLASNYTPNYLKLKVEAYISIINNSEVNIGFDFFKILVVVAVILLMNKKNRINKISMMFCKAFLYIASLQMIFIANQILYNRLSLYRIVFEGVAISTLVIGTKNKPLIKAFIFISCLMICAFYWYKSISYVVYSGEASWFTMTIQDYIQYQKKLFDLPIL